MIPAVASRINGDAFEHVTDSEKSVLLMVRRYLTHARTTKTTGKIAFEVQMKCGGIARKSTTVTAEEP